MANKNYDNLQLHWSTHIDSSKLLVEGLRASGVIGLSDQNRRLLEQRGADVDANQNSKTLNISTELITQVSSRSGSPLHQSLSEDEDDHEVSCSFLDI